MLLISDFSPFSHSQIPGHVRDSKDLRLGRPADIALQKQHLLLGPKRQGTCQVGGYYTLAFLWDRARDQNLLQWTLPAEVPQPNSQKMKRFAGSTVIVGQRHQVAIRMR